jgi:hypothetical protein
MKLGGRPKIFSIVDEALAIADGWILLDTIANGRFTLQHVKTGGQIVGQFSWRGDGDDNKIIMCVSFGEGLSQNFPCFGISLGEFLNKNLSPLMKDMGDYNAWYNELNSGYFISRLNLISNLEDYQIYYIVDLNKISYFYDGVHYLWDFSSNPCILYVNDIQYQITITYSGVKSIPVLPQRMLRELKLSMFSDYILDI